MQVRQAFRSLRSHDTAYCYGNPSADSPECSTDADCQSLVGNNAVCICDSYGFCPGGRYCGTSEPGSCSTPSKRSAAEKELEIIFEKNYKKMVLANADQDIGVSWLESHRLAQLCTLSFLICPAQVHSDVFPALVIELWCLWLLLPAFKSQAARVSVLT